MTDYREKAYESGLLDKDYHHQLVADIENIARSAGVPVPMLWTSAATYCEPEELDYLQQPPQDDLCGFVYTAKYIAKSDKHHTVHMRMCAMAAAYMRNFLNARVMPLHAVMAALKKDAMPSPTALFIPDFYDSKASDAFPSWQVSGLLGMLIDRMGRGQQTFLYAETLKGVESHYGGSMFQHLNTYFITPGKTEK